MCGWVLEKALFLACRWLSPHTLEWQWGVGGPSLVLRTLILLDQGPTLMNSLTLMTSLEARLQIQPLLGLGLPYKNFGKT